MNTALHRWLRSPPGCWCLHHSLRRDSKAALAAGGDRVILTSESPPTRCSFQEASCRGAFCVEATRLACMACSWTLITLHDRITAFEREGERGEEGRGEGEVEIDPCMHQNIYCGYSRRAAACASVADSASLPYSLDRSGRCLGSVPPPASCLAPPRLRLRCSAASSRAASPSHRCILEPSSPRALESSSPLAVVAADPRARRSPRAAHRAE